MKHIVAATLLVLLVAGCGGNKPATESTVEPSATSATAPAESAGCTSSGLDAMTALSNFQLEMDAAQKAGKLTIDQLVAARDILYNETQAAAAKEDWTAYCKAIDSVRADLGL